MKKLYEKNELNFAIACIAAYCVIQSLANPLNNLIGVAYSASALFCAVQSAILFTFLKRNGLLKRYGLCKPAVPARRFLYYVPLVLLATGNLWFGVTGRGAEVIPQIICMLFVGFLEELIFRGFLFQALAKDSVKTAVVISSVTFGVGHILNLVNGSGMGLVENLCQIFSAIAAGFLFVTLYDRGGSLIPCIVTHSAINISSIFGKEAGVTAEIEVIHCLVMTVMMMAYTVLLLKTLPKPKRGSTEEGQQ